MRATIHNISKANQGVWTDEGLVHIEPGRQRTVTIAEGHEERVQGLPFLKVEVKGEGLSAGAGDLSASRTVSVTDIQPHTETWVDGVRHVEKNGPIQTIVTDAETFDAELLSAATDEELAQMHQDKFGKPPHHAAKRETIIAKLTAPAEGEG
jgi:hypothetical protein